MQSLRVELGKKKEPLSVIHIPGYDYEFTATEGEKGGTFIHISQDLKVVSATFLLVCFVCLKESTCETRKNAFYFTSKALLVLEIIKF